MNAKLAAPLDTSAPDIYAAMAEHVSAGAAPDAKIEWISKGATRWIGVASNGAKFVIDADNETPIGGTFYSLSRLTDAPAGARHLGGSSELELVQAMALRHLTTGRV